LFLINNGITLFNNADFFAAHDFFEDLWMEAKNEDKLFFQGLVQVSVGCYHFICGNFKGSKSQLLKSLGKLNLYQPVHYKVNICKFVLDIKKLIELISQLDELNNFKITSIMLPRIKLLTNV